MANLRNDRRLAASEFADKQLANDITGYVGSEAMAILVDRPEEIGPLRDALYARRDAAPLALKPFEGIHALEDFVPRDQARKIPLLLAIKAKLLRARSRGLISDADWADVERHLPAADVEPFQANDLPADVARAFTETDGTRGRIVYISPTDEKLTEDAHYLLRWADAYRETRLPDGSVVIAPVAPSSTRTCGHPSSQRSRRPCPCRS